MDYNEQPSHINVCVIMKNSYHHQREILEPALEAFQKTTRLSAHVLSHSETEFIIGMTHKTITYPFQVNFRPNLTKTILALAVLESKNSTFFKQILVTRYVTPPMSEQMKELNQPFIDTAGNAYINEEHLFVYVKGNKLKPSPYHFNQKRLFKAAGLRVIFALLCNPGLENTPFRNIAKAAPVALGSVEAVMVELKRLGYLIERKKGQRQLLQSVIRAMGDILSGTVETQITD